MFHDIYTAIPLGFFLAFLLGPVFFVLLETAAIKGFRAAISFDIGVVLADVVFLLIAYFSTSKLLESIKDDPALFIFGGVIMTTYGVITFMKLKKSIPTTEQPGIRKLSKSDYFGLAVKGFLLNFINIGVLGFWLGLIIIFGPKMDMNPERLLVFFGSVLGTYLIIDILKILLAKKLNHKLTPVRIFNMKRIISIVIIVFGGILISQGLFPSELEAIKHEIEERMPETPLN